MIDESGRFYVDGRWQAASGAEFAVIDPADEQTLGIMRECTPEDIEGAMDAARQAYGSWSALPAASRGDFVRAIAAVIERHHDELAYLLVREVGKPMREAYAEVEFAVAHLRYMAAWDRRLEGDVLPGESAMERIDILRVPVGVVAAICPWNFPLALYARKVGPALVSGNTVVLKPSDVTPVASLKLTRLIDDEVGLPRGVLNVVVGGSPTGEAMVRTPHVDLISMTGHVSTGKKIMAIAAENLTRVSLELGGKAPAIVWQDATVDSAAVDLAKSRHTNAGQVCTCPERVLVHEDVYDAFVEKYERIVASLRVGNPLLDDVDVGPLASAQQLEKTSQSVETARGDGANVTVGGDRPRAKPFQKGFWYKPTVIRDVEPDMEIMHEETFGPVTPIVRVRSLEEAVAVANGTQYGLSAYVFTNSYRTVMALTDRLECGEIYVNRPHGEAVHGFHAGHKCSGIGGEDGKYGLQEYTALRTVYHNYA